MNKASLTVVGSGIKFLSHMTTEVKAYIEQSDKVLFLVNDPAMKQWIEKSNPRAESLDKIYRQYPQRIDCYHAIADYILENVRQNQHVCVVLYGHPSVFAQPGLEAVQRAREQGFEAKLLPGISAEDCLYADLLIDPGTCGCQSFEATDFLIYQRKFDPSCHLILWQVDVIGVLDNPEIHDNHHGARVLRDYLSQYYADDHQIVLYEAAQYPSFEPRIQKLLLKALPLAIFSRIMTLYVPPAYVAPCSNEFLNALKMNMY